VLANTTELHARIDRMTRRIRELEYGLQQLQATVSNETHPHLRDDHPLKDTSVAAAMSEAAAHGTIISPMPNGTSPPAPPPSELPSSNDTPPDEFIDAFGMFTPYHASPRSLFRLFNVDSGTLSIGAQGETRFYGATARGEVSSHHVTKSSVCSR
jgi:hypothetical protein